VKGTSLVISACLAFAATACTTPEDGGTPPTTTAPAPVVSKPTASKPKPTVRPTTKPTKAPTTKPTKRARAPFESCAQARASGVPLPLTPGSPGWNPELDRDGDGKACE
jgi:hypothetical protein